VSASSIFGVDEAEVEVIDGALPDGLELKCGMYEEEYFNEISGTPTKAGFFTFTIRVTDIVGSVTKEMSIFIAGAAKAPAIMTGSLPAGREDKLYEQELKADGTSPIT